MTRSPTLAEEGDALSLLIRGGLLVIVVVVNYSEAIRYLIYSRSLSGQMKQYNEFSD